MALVKGSTGGGASSSSPNVSKVYSHVVSGRGSSCPSIDPAQTAPVSQRDASREACSVAFENMRMSYNANVAHCLGLLAYVKSGGFPEPVCHLMVACAANFAMNAWYMLETCQRIEQSLGEPPVGRSCLSVVAPDGILSLVGERFFPGGEMPQPSLVHACHCCGYRTGQGDHSCACGGKGVLSDQLNPFAPAVVRFARDCSLYRAGKQVQAYRWPELPAECYGDGDQLLFAIVPRGAQHIAQHIPAVGLTSSHDPAMFASNTPCDQRPPPPERVDSYVLSTPPPLPPSRGRLPQGNGLVQPPPPPHGCVRVITPLFAGSPTVHDLCATPEPIAPAHANALVPGRPGLHNNGFAAAGDEFINLASASAELLNGCVRYMRRQQSSVHSSGPADLFFRR